MTIGDAPEPEVLVGVTSFITETCGTGLDGSVRVDLYRDWIRTYIADHDVLAPECDGDGICATGCSAVDPDCPCANDGFCSPACDDIASDVECAGCGSDKSCRIDCPVLNLYCCVTDGMCHLPCGTADTDCLPHEEGARDETGDGGGCTTGGNASWLFGLALGALLLRRRAPRTR
jgi:hypothetical protein